MIFVLWCCDLVFHHAGQAAVRPVRGRKHIGIGTPFEQQFHHPVLAIEGGVHHGFPGLDQFGFARSRAVAAFRPPARAARASFRFCCVAVTRADSACRSAAYFRTWPIMEIFSVVSVVPKVSSCNFGIGRNPVRLSSPISSSFIVPYRNSDPGNLNKFSSHLDDWNLSTPILTEVLNVPAACPLNPASRVPPANCSSIEKSFES